MGDASRIREGIVAGAFGAALAAAVSIGLGLLLGVPSLPELLSDWLLERTPGPLFSFALDWLQTAAKPLFYLAIVLALVALGAAVGGWVSRRAPSSLLGGALLAALALWGVQELVVLPLVGAGVFGQAPRFAGPLGPAVRLLALLVYGSALAGVLALLRPESRFLPTRRAAMRAGILGVLALVSGGALARALGGARAMGAGTRVTPRRGTGLPEPITPVGQFYSISKNFFDPVVDRARWRLEITGLVQQPLRFTLDQLRALPQYDQLQTLICISNEVGGDLISNGAWRGVRLGELLSRAGVADGAVDVVFICADGYTDSIPLAVALDPRTLLALEMNGQPLTDTHGAPLRCIVPDIYGMKHAKWIRTIDVVATDYHGFWQRQGWSDRAVIHTLSRIDYPRDGARLPFGEIEVGGIAFAGARGIRAVELSFDDGATWRPAALREEFGPLSWRFWTSRWRPERPGPHAVLVRATDGSGAQQTAVRAGPFPDGATGYHRVVLHVQDR
ncbi:MAG: molybdopterin-dependent oxidoreductase [Chloroflexota bacterium]|nr:molybdopterin-dependent oxidoreductase [Dehalococcoidia bacterium]MDW8252305.1 molybdopterin-dependent oxidoreductase [Chloroflexota bacterium]